MAPYVLCLASYECGYGGRFDVDVDERALGAQPLPGTQPPAADLFGQRAPDLLRRPPGGTYRHQELVSMTAMASGDSGSTWPPSTTIV